jgi:excisionase family DNA binding protein
MAINSSPSEPNNEFRDFVLDDIAHHRKLAPTKLLLTITEACQVLAISRSKLYGLLNAGHLPSVHIGRSRRIRMTDLEEFVNVGGHDY